MPGFVSIIIPPFVFPATVWVDWLGHPLLAINNIGNKCMGFGTFRIFDKLDFKNKNSDSCELFDSNKNQNMNFQHHSSSDIFTYSSFCGRYTCTIRHYRCQLLASWHKNAILITPVASWHWKEFFQLPIVWYQHNW